MMMVNLQHKFLNNSSTNKGDKMNDEELYHLIDILNERTTSILMDGSKFRLMSQDQKNEALLFNIALIEKLRQSIQGK